jgi:hypothetical protein
VADFDLGIDLPLGRDLEEVVEKNTEGDFGLVHRAGAVAFLLSEKVEVFAEMLFVQRGGVGIEVSGGSGKRSQRLD